MNAKVFPVYRIDEGMRVELLRALRCAGEVFGPVVAADGICRLAPWHGEHLPESATLPRLPLKKLLIPTGEPLWSWSGEAFTSAPEPPPLAVVGLPPCEMQAAWYLDQVFRDDEVYQRRRGKLLLIGGKCTPGPDCRCDSTLPLAGDLLLGSDWLWCLSAAGAELVAATVATAARKESRSLPDIVVNAGRTALTEELFAATGESKVWEEEGAPCLSCGACSALCPTCYCFDTLDDIGLSGDATRRRVWDNCFFAEHGQVAGGHDFRRGRAARLRFRAEHKRLGFGALRGVDACVGCGRCRQGCPVGIDLDRVVARLATEAGP